MNQNLNNRSKERGFIGTIILVILALALLKYFLDWSVFDLLDTEKGRATVIYIKDILVGIWSFIKGIFSS